MNGENHHIIPKSIRPDLAKDKDNIIRLTYREHYIAHLCLYKIYEDDKMNKYKMACAWVRMCKNNDGHHVSSHVFELVKRIRNNTPVPLETKIKMSKARKGKPNGFKGRHHTPEARKNMSLAHIGQKAWNKGKKTRPLTEYEKETQRRIQKELVYWTNGVENKRCKESPGEVWHKGRTIKDRTKFATNVGKHWFTNGLNDVCAFESPGPGWQPGRTYHKA